MDAPVTVNGRQYGMPLVPAIVIRIDECEPAYLELAVSAGLMPNFERIRRSGTSRLAYSAIPSFTNPNNLSIAAGGSSCRPRNIGEHVPRPGIR